MQIKYRNKEITGKVIKSTIDEMIIEITSPYQNFQNRTDYYYNNTCHLNTNPKFKKNNKLTEYGKEIANLLLKHLYVACKNIENNKQEIKDIIDSTPQRHLVYYQILDLIKVSPSSETIDAIVKRFVTDKGIYNNPLP